MKELLPIGSIVQIENVNKKFMIIGRIQKLNDQPDVIYDYAACLYPEGYLSKDAVYLFNQESIRNLYYIGMQDQEEFNFRHELENQLNQLKNKAGS